MPIRLGALHWISKIQWTNMLVLLARMEDATAASALAGFSAKLNLIATPMRKSFTDGRGKEMARHTELAAPTGVKVYFYDPHPCGKGDMRERQRPATPAALHPEGSVHGVDVQMGLGHSMHGSRERKPNSNSQCVRGITAIQMMHFTLF